jgi:hypothetical protein
MNRREKMKKLLITGVLLLSVLILAGAQQGYAYDNVTSSPNGGCLICHAFAGGSGSGHTTHSGASVSCTSCHVTPGSTPVKASKCIVCHPQGNVGQCNLVNLASHPKTGAQACLTCHPSCAPTTTTTIPSGSCIDNDNDTYGENCTPGPDCDDTDPAIHEGCEIDCTLTITPKTFSPLRAVVLPFQFFIIRADRDSSISFTSPICIFWGSEGIDDVIRIRLGEKLIIGYVRVWPTHLTAGDFKVYVTFGDTSETQCGPITVKGSGSSSFIQDKRVKVQKSCGNN